MGGKALSPFSGEPETHPSFGMARASRVSSSPPGASLYDSEIRHQHYVTFTISTGTRRRELNRDWLMADKEIIEISMSMAQWGALVSSFGEGSGVPVTITRFEGERIENPPYEPRMKQSTAEVVNATDKLLAEIEAATAAVREAYDRKAGRKEMSELLGWLENRLDVAKPNAKYAAETFTEHVEKVVTKARYDIEAQVQMAAERGLDAGHVTEALGMGESKQ